jgi:hypothetical protein
MRDLLSVIYLFIFAPAFIIHVMVSFQYFSMQPCHICLILQGLIHNTASLTYVLCFGLITAEYKLVTDVECRMRL